MSHSACRQTFWILIATTIIPTPIADTSNSVTAARALQSPKAWTHSLAEPTYNCWRQKQSWRMGPSPWWAGRDIEGHLEHINCLVGDQGYSKRLQSPVLELFIALGCQARPEGPNSIWNKYFHCWQAALRSIQGNFRFYHFPYNQCYFCF